MAKSMKNWTSEEVKMVIEKMKLGSDDVKETPFFDNDIDLKKANIIFTHTPEELEEFMKCSQDCVYFTSKYCNFLTDFGRKPVKLRPYQKNLLNVLTDEHYIPELDENGPKNRNVIMMQSRQTGKCINHNTIIHTNNNIHYINELYKDDRITFYIKKILYKMLKYLT